MSTILNLESKRIESSKIVVLAMPDMRYALLGSTLESEYVIPSTNSPLSSNSSIISVFVYINSSPTTYVLK